MCSVLPVLYKLLLPSPPFSFSPLSSPPLSHLLEGHTLYKRTQLDRSMNKLVIAVSGVISPFIGHTARRMLPVSDASIPVLVGSMKRASKRSSI